MAKTTYSREELEQQLSESRREFWAADATINNLELKIADMAAQLANAENKCAALATELEASGKLIDTLRQDKDKVIDMSIERVNRLLSRAEAAEKRIAELEARGISLPERSSMLHRTDFHDVYQTVMAYKVSEVIDAIRAAGISIKGE